MSTSWTEWEDYSAGLYLPAWTQEHVAASLGLLSDPGQFHEVAREMIREWPAAAWQNLRHMWSGRNAWLGQAACLYCHQAPGGATRAAWGQMSNTSQRAANEVARVVRAEWERSDDAETLFAL